MHIPDVPIRDENIRLGQFIKLANLVDSGGVAKEIISGGGVFVNGVQDMRRGKLLCPGDEVKLLDPDTGDFIAAARVAAPVEFDESEDDSECGPWRAL